MSFPRFISRHTEDRWEYHLPVSYERFIGKSVFDNTPVKLDQEHSDELHQFCTAQNISSYVGWDENSILYRIVLNAFAKSDKCLLVYFGNEKDAEQITHSKPNKAEWWNSIQFMEGDGLCESFGIQNPSGFLHSANYSNKNLTNRHFYISEVDSQSISRYTTLYSSDVTNWFFLFCDTKQVQTVTALLSNEAEKPDIRKLLELCTCTVNIQIGGDEGYLDYVLIQSRNEITDVIMQAEKKQQEFITAYKNLLDECVPFDHEWKVDFFKERFSAIINGLG